MNDAQPFIPADRLRRPLNSRRMVPAEWCRYRCFRHDNDAGQPTASRQRKLLTALAVTLVVAALILVIDFGVRVMHFILTVWYGDPNEQTQPAPPSVNQYDPTKPFCITVNPPADDSEQPAACSQQVKRVSCFFAAFSGSSRTAP